MTADEFRKQIEATMRANRDGAALSPAAASAVRAAMAAIETGDVSTLADEAEFLAAVRATFLLRDQIDRVAKGEA